MPTVKCKKKEEKKPAFDFFSLMDVKKIVWWGVF